MTPTQSVPLVLLSIAIAVVASYAALVLTARVADARGRARRRWLLGGGGAMGTGIWSMHFVAMLAIHLPSPVAHHVSSVLLSLAVAIGASVLALSVASRPVLERGRLAVAALAMGAGIAGMHYIGMAGMVTTAHVHYQAGRVALSLGVAVGASLVALWLAFHLRDPRSPGWARLLSTGVMGGAIAGMHYTGMSAAYFVPTSGVQSTGRALVFGTTALAGTVAAAACALLLLAVFAARFELRARTRSAVILERITDGFLAFDPEGYCTYANRAAELLLRQPREAMCGGKLHDFIPGAADSALGRACRRAMAEQVTLVVEEFQPSLALWLEVHVYASANGLSVYFRDVTARKEANEALLRREQQLADAQRIAHVGSWEWDVPTGEVSWSAETYRIFGLEPGSDSPTFDDFLACIHPDHRAGAADLLGGALDAGSDFEMVRRIVRPNGDERIVHCQGRMTLDDAGRALRFTGTCQDVTERTEAEERFRELAENVREVFWIMSPADGRLLYVSPAVEEVWGYTPEALAGDPRLFLQTIHPDDRAHVSHAFSALKQDGNDVEYRIVRPDGEVRWIRDRGFPVRDLSGALVRVVGVADDVTARKRAEETVRANERQAQKMAERMSAVAAAAAATIGTRSPEELRAVIVDATRRVLAFDTFSFALLDEGGASLSYLGDYDDGVYGPARVVALPGTPGERVLRERHSLLTRHSTDPAARGGVPWGTARRSESGIRAPILSGDDVLGMITVQSYTPELYDERDVEVLEALAALAASALRHIFLRAEQDAAEEALRQSERDYRGLFENAHDAIIILHPEGERVLDVNPRACELYGYPREIFVGMSLEAVSSDVEGGRALVRETLNRGVPRQFEVVQRGADGSELHVEVTATTIPYRGGQAILSINRDITARRSAEAALRASELKFRSVTQSAADGIVTINAENRIVSWNRGAEAVFGYTEAEALDQPLQMVIPERFRERYGSGVARLARAGSAALQGTVVELSGLRRDGREFPLELSLALWEAGGRSFATGIIRDISERRQAEEALRRSQEQLAQAQKMEAVGRLAGGVAHDFNNLLTVISGNATLAVLDREADAELRDYLAEISGAADRAANLTRQLLAYSRQQVLQPRLLDLDTVVSGMHRMLSRLIAEDVDVVLKLHGSLAPVKADPTQMEQVILNLAVNARDAMPDGGQMMIRTRALVLARPEQRGDFELPAGSYAVLSVADTGCGMDRDTLRRVFEPFFTTKAEERGTGLGLATVYGIVKQSGGFIEVESELERGTRFDIYLPSAAPAPPEPGSDDDAPAHLRAGSGTILLVEDDLSVRRVGSRALARGGYTVLNAANGEEGLAMAAAHPGLIDLVVTDVVMPRMGGREFVKRLTVTRPGTRVLFTSGFIDDAVLRPEAFEPGAHFLPKPFGPGDLLERVVEVLTHA